MIPIARPGQDKPVGVFITALNPYRQFDNFYEGYLDLIVGQIAASITNATAYEQERKRAEELAELDLAKTTFFSNVSHELRTPLTLILGPIEDALTSQTPPSPENLEMLHRNALRLLKLVNGLLDFVRIEVGRLRARYEATDLSLLTAQLASVFRSAVERAGLQLVVDCPPLPEPSTSTGRCGRRSFSISSPTRSNRRLRVRFESPCEQKGSMLRYQSAIPGREYQKTICPISSSDSGALKVRDGAAMRAAELAWRWCRSWWRCTAALSA